MITELKVTRIEHICHTLFRINSRTTIRITYPVDKDEVNKYYTLFYNIRNANCLCSITESGLVAHDIGTTALIKRDKDNYLIRIFKRYYNGIGQLKTISSTINTTLEGAVLKIEEIFS